MMANLLFNSQVGNEWGVFLTFKARVLYPAMRNKIERQKQDSITSDEQSISERMVKQQKLKKYIILIYIQSLQTQQGLQGNL